MKWKALHQLIVMTKYAFIGTVLQAVFASLLFASDSWAQKSIEEVYINARFENATVHQVFKSIERQTGFKFVYKEEVRRQGAPITFPTAKAPLAALLRHIAQENQLTFQRVNNVISVAVGNSQSADRELVTELPLVQLQVSGVVTSSEDGMPLPGVSILVKGTASGTTTDVEGRFSLTAAEGSVLQFSYIGHITQEVTIGSQTTLSISLKPDMSQLEEVVVVGYGTQRKENLTGAVSTVTSKAIENRPVSNVANALQGTTPGLIVTRTNGQPGSENIGIQVRGATSANGNVNPLLMVDGIPAPIFTLQTLNPNDIESVTVLKDAAAAAIYGAQAAGGVILVTTKQGVKGKTVFEYSNQIGVDWALNVPKRLPLLEEAEYANLARSNRGLGPEYSAADIENIRNNVPFIVNPSDTTRYIFYNQQDQIGQVLRDRTPVQMHNLSARGGTDNVNYMLSLGYYEKQGVFKLGPDQLRRYNARLNLGAQLTRHLLLNSMVAYTLQKQEAPSQGANGNGLLYQTYRLRTRFPIFTPEGRLNGEGGSSGNNAYAVLRDGGYNNMDRNFFDGTFTLKAKDMIKGLSVQAIYGAQYRRGDRELFARTVELWRRFSPSFYLNNPNRYELTRDVQVNTNFQFLVDYDKKIGQKHNFHLLLGYQWEDSRFSSVFSGANSLVSNDLPSLNLGDDRTKTNSQTINTFANQSYFTRFNYNYDGKYLLEATLRIDESSRLAPGLRTKAFPAVSAGWNMHREDWFANTLPFFSEFKFRASWGQLGSALGGSIGLYDYLNLLSRNSNLVLGTPEARTTYFFQNTVPSSSLTWETVETTNGGVDFGLFGNRLSVSADYYVKYNRNMLTPLQLPATFGVNTPRVNNGVLKSWGWELDVRYRSDAGKALTYSVGFNLSDNNNKLREFAGRRVVSAGTVDVLEGYPLNTIWGFRTNGYFQDAAEVANAPFQDSRTGPGDIRFVNQNNDERITPGRGTLEDPGDLVMLGTDQPRWLFGMNSTIEWKGFDFVLFFQGVGKRSFLPNRNTIMPLAEAWIQALAVHRDYWTPENPNAAFPRPFLQGHHNYVPSDKWVLNGRYIRLKNIQLGYTVPSHILEKAKFSRARIFLTGQDILTISSMGVFNGLFDPENSNAAGSDYPFFATAAMGINLSF